MALHDSARKVPVARTFPTAVLLILALLASASCDPGTRYEVLSTFLDGVPPPGTQPAPRRPVWTRRQFPEPEVDLAEQDPNRPKPTPKDDRIPTEKAHAWDEAFPLIPKDDGGGADWVRALKSGAIRPRHSLDPEPPPAPVPFPLEVRLDPDDRNFERFTVIFPHFPHTLWLRCANCHPDIFRMKAGANPITMTKVFSGEYCGRCHGRVAFAPGTGCARCHVRLLPPRANEVRQDLATAREKPLPASASLVERGKKVYRTYCVFCHGENGAGDGPAAPSLDPKPRDFTKGKYKFRTTPGSSIPTDFDIFRTITMGVPATSMPAWVILSYEERWGLVHYLKTLSERFQKETPGASLEISSAPPPTPEVLAEGRQFYMDGGCNACHGDEGGGDGDSAKSLQDDWGYPIRPYNFRSGRPYKSGPSIEDVYRTVMTGLTGTPMPSFGDVFEPAQAWAVVQYVYSLGEESRVRSAEAGINTGEVISLPGGREIAADLTKARESQVPASAELIEKGKAAYAQNCVVCHGEKADGEGPAAVDLDPKPRDFTKGKYKFRTTPGSSIPTDFDIFRTITVGVPGTSMPGWAVISYEDRWGIVHYLKTLSERFEKETAGQPLEIPEPPAETAEILAEGRQLFMDGGCNACHGDQGRGDGGAAESLQDDWGNPIRPFNFTSGKPYKSGPTPQDVYRTVMTGLTGGPMPSFGDVFEPAQAWAVVLYVRSLGAPGSTEVSAR